MFPTSTTFKYASLILLLLLLLVFSLQHILPMLHARPLLLLDMNELTHTTDSADCTDTDDVKFGAHDACSQHFPKFEEVRKNENDRIKYLEDALPYASEEERPSMIEELLELKNAGKTMREQRVPSRPARPRVISAEEIRIAKGELRTTDTFSRLFSAQKDEVALCHALTLRVFETFPYV